MDTLNLISVSETAKRDLTATGARLAVRISGQAFFTGTQAFKKAAEVAACIASLAECGIAEADVRLLNVVAEVESGFLTKSSSATYDLGIKCRSIEILAPVIGAISSQKNAKIFSIAWDYPDLAKTQKDVLQQAVRAAIASAKAIADALNVSVLGVHKLSYDISGLDTELRTPVVSKFARTRALKAADTELSAGGLIFSHTTEIAVTVQADFLVGMLSNAT